MIDFMDLLGVFTWDWDPALLRIGDSFELRYYGVLFALALAVGYTTIRWRYKDENEERSMKSFPSLHRFRKASRPGEPVIPPIS